MSTAPPGSLPHPRAFMNSLFNTLTASSSSSIPNPSPNPSLSFTDPHPSVSSLNANRRANDEVREKENPLKNIGAEKKALLMTLHVVFPPPLLLQALDLLDRGCVGRVVWLGEEGGREAGRREREVGGENGANGGEGRKEGGGGEVEGAGCAEIDDREADRDDDGDFQRRGEMNSIIANTHNREGETTEELAGSVIPPQAHMHLPPLIPAPNPTPSTASKPKKITIHQVRSSQPPKWSSHTHSHAGARSGFASAPSENTYNVHLDAWNCTCAAFTFSAFPASSSQHSAGEINWSQPSYHSPDHSNSHNEHFLNEDPKGKFKQGNTCGREEEEEEEWQYGGLAKTPQVPVCKHLVACFLGERWREVLGAYVGERVVGREEMSGLLV
ncbi:hypothetical protein NHQ30_003916 [Ciborinia camelliae]|nr:hypothetical protein NHQ30_003916 [Ciborinia camelliae]